jgi:hypothetical protein
MRPRSGRGRKALVREFGLHRPLHTQLQPRCGVCGRSSGGAGADIEAAFADPTVDAIVCLGGGHASVQLLRLLDYELIAGNPKPFVGFSDITALHAALGKQAALVTFWGPMFAQLGSASAATRACLLHTLMGEPQTRLVARAGDVARTLVGGTAEGELVGGTLSLLSSLLGTPWAVATPWKNPPARGRRRGAVQDRPVPHAPLERGDIRRVRRHLHRRVRRLRTALASLAMERSDAHGRGCGRAVRAGIGRPGRRASPARAR